MSQFFRVTERNHAAMVLMTELAARFKSKEWLSLTNLGVSHGISPGYLEEIVALLKKAGLVKGRAGRTGGYQLAKDPKTITAHAILTSLEGSLDLLPCLTTEASCAAAPKCSSRSFWHTMQKKITHALKQTTLAELSSPRHSAEGPERSRGERSPTK
ncbi:MAG: Rrf2 family transcriptional regulator [bacterium]|nr:Rrf2 family transcriptional regulator [bacterium]